MFFGYFKNLNFLFEFCFGNYATTKVITGGSDSSFSSEIKICQMTVIHKLRVKHSLFVNLAAKVCVCLKNM